MDCQAALHQIEVAVETIDQIIDTLLEEDLLKQPTPYKHSIGELLEHLALICVADRLIANEASKEEMESFYSNISYKTLALIKDGLRTNFKTLKTEYLNLTDEELKRETTSYWGVTYT
ncbi:DinB family protein [Lederbergia galactosidilytica]|uniref:DinB-like domain-containing protein n=1 Tax=Lederbergia galactosidilytica TaxID=217031 RepID=A0A0Q9Y773_9BACI|nr:hypothetical protein ACA29_09805 [Lederbergia galactosidilytica]KRG13743.1 hypothetical protein ACA30_14695 [Virgibacillus soli]MBP1917154.1 putative damage-inducible protein DinB [Lederbergia galactosidilytica]OAK70732.1 hypothetical protein ABB05_12195 [Lederbergia galactosidilytica]